MFGYVLPLRGELKCAQWDRYQAAYCGLCHTVGKRYGLFPRMFLSYDFTFLTLLLTGDHSACQKECHRCPTAPLRKKCMLLHHGGLDAAADEMVILSYWKLRDDVADHGFWKGLPARVLAALLKRAYRKASGLRPEFDRTVRACLEELTEIERQKLPSIDRPADTFARILQAAAPPSGDEGRDRAMGQVLYHVGRWIYLIDARADLQEDRKSGNYNPLCFRFSAEEDFDPYLRSTLNQSLHLADSAFALLEPSENTPILENILQLGLPKVEQAVFSGRWKRTSEEFRRNAT